MKVHELVSVFNKRTQLHILNMVPYCHCLFYGNVVDFLNCEDTIKNCEVYQAYPHYHNGESRLTILLIDIMKARF